MQILKNISKFMQLPAYIWRNVKKEREKFGIVTKYTVYFFKRMIELNFKNVKLMHSKTLFKSNVIFIAYRKISISFY